MSECQQFAKMIRVVRFVGMGEPLLHPKITDMIYSVHKYCITDSVELLTNGVNLGPPISDRLASSGLNKLLISVQGERQDMYKTASGKKFDFIRFMDNLAYTYEMKRDMHIHIKGIDCNIENEEDFYELFSPVCDTVSIEKAGPIYEGVEKNKEFKSETTQYGAEKSDVRICPQPFTSLQLHPDGKVIPCYAIENKEYVGDCNEESLFDIWHGEKLKDFRKRMIEGRVKVNKTCANCKIITHRMYPEDSFDNAVERLKEAYKC